MLTVLGLDLSLNSTGMAIINSTGMCLTQAITPGVKGINSKTGRKKKSHLIGLQRQINILNKIQDCIQEYKPQYAALEAYSFASKGRALFQLGELGGMVKVLLWNNNIPFQTFAPQTVKKFLIGHRVEYKKEKGKLTSQEKRAQRKRSKRAMLDECLKQRNRFQYNVSERIFTDDEADAFAIAKLKYGIEKKKLIERVGFIVEKPIHFLEHQLEVVDKWSNEKVDNSTLKNLGGIL